MASEFYGLNRGVLDGQDQLVTVGTSTGSTDVELRVDTGKGTTRKDIRILLMAILRYIEGTGGNVPVTPVYPPL